MTLSIAQWTEIAGRALRIFAILAVALILARALKAVTNRLVEISKTHTRAAQMREQQTRTMAAVLYSGGLALITVVAVLAALPEFGFHVGSLLAAAGIAGAVVGFGAQNIIKDMTNGFFIAFEDQYVIGDLIQLNGETGRVELLTLRRTVIRNLSGALVTIPNSLVGQVANLGRDWSQVFVDVTVPADEMVGRALDTLDKVAGEFRNDPDWSPALVDGPRVLGVESLSLDGTDLRLQVRTALNRKDDVARELRRRIKMAFEQSGIPLHSTHKIELHGEIPPPPT
ncbi:MAG: mechanosensitive ion channel family protein [Candidatus Acidiferrales bacterium]